MKEFFIVLHLVSIIGVYLLLRDIQRRTPRIDPPPVDPPPVDPPPPIKPPQPTWTKPSRENVLNRLHADIAPTGAGFESLVLRQTSRGADILGTWGWLALDDDTFATIAAAYRSRGLSLVPCNVRESGYQGQHYDFTTDVALLRTRLTRVYQAGLIPMINLQVYGDNEGQRSVTLWKTLLPEIADLMTSAFFGWELVVDGGPSGFTPDELDELIAIVRQQCPDAVLGIEFATPEDHEPICYDGRRGGDTQTWWTRGPGRHLDVLMLEIGYHRAEDEQGFVDDVAGAVCRIQGPYPVTVTWPDGTVVDPAIRANWIGPDYGSHKVVMLFEYAAYLCWSSERKRARRAYVQAMVPTLTAYGEG